jgi:hypothetical protein
MSRITRAALIVGVMFLTGACATSEDWKVWLGHNTHFASGDHGMFSLRNNKDGSNPRVTRSDIDNSRRENWWGIYAVSVSPSQIIQG